MSTRFVSKIENGNTAIDLNVGRNWKTEKSVDSYKLNSLLNSKTNYFSILVCSRISAGLQRCQSCQYLPRWRQGRFHRFSRFDLRVLKNWKIERKIVKFLTKDRPFRMGTHEESSGRWETFMSKGKVVCSGHLHAATRHTRKKKKKKNRMQKRRAEPEATKSSPGCDLLPGQRPIDVIGLPSFSGCCWLAPCFGILRTRHALWHELSPLFLVAAAKTFLLLWYCPVILCKSYANENTLLYQCRFLLFLLYELIRQKKKANVFIFSFSLCSNRLPESADTLRNVQFGQWRWTLSRHHGSLPTRCQDYRWVDTFQTWKVETVD